MQRASLICITTVAGLGSRVWGSALLLCDALVASRKALKGCTVLELGRSANPQTPSQKAELLSSTARCSNTRLPPPHSLPVYYCTLSKRRTATYQPSASFALLRRLQSARVCATHTQRTPAAANLRGIDVLRPVSSQRLRPMRTFGR